MSSGTSNSTHSLLFSFLGRRNFSTLHNAFFRNQNFNYTVTYTAQNTSHAMMPHYTASQLVVVYFKPSSHLEISVHSVTSARSENTTDREQTFSEGLRCWCLKQVLCSQWKHTVCVRTFHLFPKFCSCCTFL